VRVALGEEGEATGPIGAARDALRGAASSVGETFGLLREWVAEGRTGKEAAAAPSEDAGGEGLAARTRAAWDAASGRAAAAALRAREAVAGLAPAPPSMPPARASL
jgi:hypothetical protein